MPDEVPIPVGGQAEPEGGRLFKVATFNVNSVRARLPIVLDWLAANRPDVLALQETKCDDEKFPVSDFQDIGYQVAAHGMKSYNGVALVSPSPAREVQCSFSPSHLPIDCRLIAGTFDGIRVINTYVPNGTKIGTDKFLYKLEWLKLMRQYSADALAQGGPCVWLGDINIAPTPDDVYNSKRYYGGVGHHPLEFEALQGIVDEGWIDTYRLFSQGPGHYTYWDFFIPNALERNLGWRIDHIYASADLAGRCLGSYVDRKPRAEHRPSDHTVVVSEFRL